MRGRKPSWWREFDFLGWAGCGLLIAFTYGLFWYYTEEVKGRFDPAPVEAEASPLR